MSPQTDVQIAEMTIDLYDEVVALWEATEHIGLDDVDSREHIGAYLQRNPGLSFVASQAGRVLGAVLCGTDGRRGYLHHLAVAKTHRGRGLGRTLVQRCLTALRRKGIVKCHIFVFAKNRAGIEFWEHIGWAERVDLKVVSRTTGA